MSWGDADVMGCPSSMLETSRRRERKTYRKGYPRLHGVPARGVT